MAKVEERPFIELPGAPEVLRLHSRRELVWMAAIAAIVSAPYVLLGAYAVAEACVAVLQRALVSGGTGSWYAGLAASFPFGALGPAMLSVGVGVAIAHGLTGRDGMWFCLGTLYLYEDRLMWRLWGWARCVYFSGTERVRCGTKWLTLSQEGARIRIPYIACLPPRYEDFHALLCARSEVYREALEPRFPWQISSARRIYLLFSCSRGHPCSCTWRRGRVWGC